MTGNCHQLANVELMGNTNCSNALVDISLQFMQARMLLRNH